MNRKINLKNLNSKLILFFMLFAILIFMIIWFMQAVMINTTYKVMKKSQIKKLYNTVQKIYEDKDKNEDYESLINNLSYKNDVKVMILDNNLDTIFSNDDVWGRLPKECEMDVSKILSGLKVTDNIDEDLKMHRFNMELNVYANKVNNEYIVILSTIEPVEATVSVLKVQLLYVTIFSLIIAGIVAIIISKKISKPISKINENAKELEKGNYNIEFSKGYYTEIDELSNTLNNTAKKLKTTDQLRKEVIANVSHDLKTPLAMIKAYSEMIEDISGEEKEKRTKHLKVIQKEVDYLTLLISDMLDLSKLETTNEQLDKTKFDISKLIDEVIERFSYVLQGKEIDIIVSKEKNLEVLADRVKMSQVIYNLIANAINFVGEDNTIYVNIKKVNAKIRVEIKDNGKGISKVDLGHIFERYYKTNDKYRKTGISTGLGLSIVKNILEKHNINYGVNSQENKGTMFWLEL